LVIFSIIVVNRGILTYGAVTFVLFVGSCATGTIHTCSAPFFFMFVEATLEERTINRYCEFNAFLSTAYRNWVSMNYSSLAGKVR
jgi:hypothetical protein